MTAYAIGAGVVLVGLGVLLARELRGIWTGQ